MSTFVADVPPEDFLPLIQDLTDHPLHLNPDRHTAGLGKSQAFGLIRRWAWRPYISRNTWIRPRTYQLLIDFAKKHVPIHFDGITVNDSYQSNPHKDKGNQGVSYTICFGNYTGGNLALLGHEPIDTRYKGYLFNGAETQHWTLPFEGRRFCLVFYSIEFPKRFLPRYNIRCRLVEDGLEVTDDYEESILVINKKGKLVRTITPGIWKEFVGLHRVKNSPVRNAKIVPETETSVYHSDEGTADNEIINHPPSPPL